MMRSMLARAVVLFGAVAMMAGCDGLPAEAEGFEGTYTLTRAEGRPLPSAVFDGHVEDGNGGFQLRAEAVAGTLTLAADGRYTHTISHSRAYDGQPDQPLDLADHGSWTRAGNTLQLESDAVQNVRYTVTVEGRALTLTHDYLGEGREAAYRFTR